MQKMMNDPRLKDVKQIAFQPVEIIHTLNILSLFLMGIVLAVFIMVGERLFIRFLDGNFQRA